MKSEKSKKNKAIKLIKVEQQYFNNIKKYRKCSYNTTSINNQSSSKECNRLKSLKGSIYDNLLKTERDKTPMHINNIYNNMTPKKINELVSLKVSPHKKKDKEEMLLSKFNKNNIKPLIYRNNSSYKKIYSNRSLGNSSNFKSNRSFYKKNINDNNNNENENNTNCPKGEIKINKNEIINDKKEKKTKKTRFQKIFCCL